MIVKVYGRVVNGSTRCSRAEHVACWKMAELGMFPAIMLAHRNVPSYGNMPLRYLDCLIMGIDHTTSLDLLPSCELFVKLFRSLLKKLGNLSYLLGQQLLSPFQEFVRENLAGPLCFDFENFHSSGSLSPPDPVNPFVRDGFL
jgi:hypothetical protein